jgi:hypothetical protein
LKIPVSDLPKSHIEMIKSIPESIKEFEVNNSITKEDDHVEMNIKKSSSSSSSDDQKKRTRRFDLNVSGELITSNIDKP